MRSIWAGLFAFFLFNLSVAASSAEIKPFGREDVASDVVRLAETLPKGHFDNTAPS